MEREYHLGRHNWRLVSKRYNIGPTMTVPIVYAPAGEWVGEVARWGLIPTWWKKQAPPTLSFNARSEEAADKPMWRRNLRSARCLMPATGWYEWNEQEQVRTVSGRTSNQPYFFYCPGEGVVSIAGLWSVWRAPNGSEILSCALLTREAAGGAAAVHHRMPVVLSRDLYAPWLSPQTTGPDVKAIILASRTDMEAYPVSTKVNNTRNESPDLIERVSVSPRES
jgi:putative SOS response-associated peptidase YedK